MRVVHLIVGLSALLFGNSSFAADTFAAASNTLTIPLVKVNSVYYSNVQISVGTVVSVGSKDPSAPSYDTYNAANNQLIIPEVLVGDTSYYNVVITVASVIGVGATCATAAECSTPSVSTETVYYGPANFLNAIQASYTPGVMTSASTLTNRNRYLISDSATQSNNGNFLQVGATYGRRYVSQASFA